MKAEDFFDTDSIDTPFENGMDETVQYLNWYDMFICARMDAGSDPEDVRIELGRGALYLAKRSERSAHHPVTAEYGIGLGRVADEFKLYGFGFFCLIMAAAQEIDAHYRDVCALPDSPGSDGENLTLALAEELYGYIADDDELLGMQQIMNALRDCPLFTFTPPRAGSGSLFYTFEANRQLASILKGDYMPSGEMSVVSGETFAYGHRTVIHDRELEKIRTILAERTDPEDDPVIIQLTGAKGSGKTELIRHSLAEDTPVLFLSYIRYSELTAERAREILSDVIVRCRLLGEVCVITDIGEKVTESLNLLLELCTRQLDLIFMETRKSIEIDDTRIPCRHYRFDLSLPRASERLSLWETEFAGVQLAQDVSLKQVSQKYRLYPGVIHACARYALGMAHAEHRDEITARDITEAVLSETTSKLDELCDRIPLKYTWDDLVIDPRQRAIMETLCSRVRNRSLVDEEWGFEDKVTYGKGVSMILYGSPGTGKTMAAQVMAQDIGMALYRVDLSQLVDKYIGETEKNIGRIFDAASDGNVILFFDEADALFSKRTEVQSSNDKHANTEVAYLLQKIEQHDGVTFLATNRFADFDTAFVRRLTYAVRLERPDVQMRRQLFEKILPNRAPREDNLDLEFFAESFELSGSEIKEVLYSAAFIAAAEGAPLGNQHLVRAIKYQQEKTGKLMSDAEFGKYGGLI